MEITREMLAELAREDCRVRESWLRLWTAVAREELERHEAPWEGLDGFLFWAQVECRRRRVYLAQILPQLSEESSEAEREGAQTLIFDKGADSVDFALVNRVRPGDLVITQDYGLASICLARGARVLNQNGMEYTAENIDGLLETRYQNKKLLRAGKHPKGPAKRTKEQDAAFECALARMLEDM